MKTSSRWLELCAALSAVLLLSTESIHAADRSRKTGDAKLSIARDPGSGKVIVSWSGRGVLRQGRDLGSRFRAVGRGGGGQQGYVTQPTETQALFTLESADSPIFSGNIVGYVNLTLPPGLSLIANPLWYSNNSLSFWMPDAPDGAQVFKYTASGGYEVSTFDAETASWSNPDLQVPIGDGFYFNNPSSGSRTYLFIGDVHLGLLVNPLPAGISTKGPLVPQAGSINLIHEIPGEAGDELRIYVNDGAGGAGYQSSVFDGTIGAWVPDLSLQVGQGFWLQKQHAQDWIRIFTAN
jgi:hypothetical protein